MVEYNSNCYHLSNYSTNLRELGNSNTSVPVRMSKSNISTSNKVWKVPKVCYFPLAGKSVNFKFDSKFTVFPRIVPLHSRTTIFSSRSHCPPPQLNHQSAGYWNLPQSAICFENRVGGLCCRRYFIFICRVVTPSMDGNLLALADIFWIQGHEMTRHSADGSFDIGMRRFRALFGISHVACAYVWKLLQERHPAGSEPRHMLYALLFLRVYETEHVHSCISDRDEKTFRKHSWMYVYLIAVQLNVVRPF